MKKDILKALEAEKGDTNKERKKEIKIKHPEISRYTKKEGLGEPRIVMEGAMISFDDE